MEKGHLEAIASVLAGPGVRQVRRLADGSLSVLDWRLRKLSFSAAEVEELLAAQKRGRKGGRHGRAE